MGQTAHSSTARPAASRFVADQRLSWMIDGLLVLAVVAGLAMRPVLESHPVTLGVLSAVLVGLVLSRVLGRLDQA